MFTILNKTLKHTIHILFLFILSQSMTLANFVVNGHSRIYTSTGKNINKTIELYISFSALQQNISSDDKEDLYRLIQNNDQDTTKTKSNTVLFGRSFLKNHYELHGKKGVIDEIKRNTWIKETVDSLIKKNVDDFPQLVMNELIHEDFYKASYRLIEKGVINFKDGGYLKLMSTSAHSIAEIGDITLALNEHGEVYVNQGHICGGIIHFETHDRGKTQSALDFLNSFQSDTDDESWQSYIIESKNKTNKQKF
jgi:hypothetical protein